MTKISKNNGSKNIACLEALWDDNLEERLKEAIKIFMQTFI
jgi:hypothetical protein